MSRAKESTSLIAVETLHVAALCVASMGLLAGLLIQKVAWVNVGVSLILLLPPLRVATSMIDEARARRFSGAAMGGVVLTILFLSRRIF